MTSHHPNPDDRTSHTPIQRLIGRVVAVRPNEVRVMIRAATVSFCILMAYYIIRPLRDEVGTYYTDEDLFMLWRNVFFVMVVIVPIYIAVAGRFQRRTLVPIVYRFFAANIVIFYTLLLIAGQLRGDPDQGTTAAALVRYTEWSFYVWVSVFNLFVVSMFWALMTDLFTTDQSKRLFGFLALGGTLGGVAGSLLTSQLVGHGLIAPVHLLLVSAVLLEAAVWCVRWTSRSAPAAPARDVPSASSENDEPIAGGVWREILVVFRSPYFLFICLYIAFYTSTQGFLYFIQREIVREAFTEREARLAFLAMIDLVTNVTVIGLQCVITSRMMTRLGVGVTLTVLPVLAVLGFGTLALWPTVATLFVFQVIRRGANFAFAKPAREVLYTVIPRWQKYKSKVFIDTVVYRGSDAGAAAIYVSLRQLVGIPSIALGSAGIAALWILFGLVLGKSLASRQGGPPATDRPND